MRIPGNLARGNYYLSVCTPNGAGAYGCATTPGELRVKGGTPIRGTKVQLPRARPAGARAAQAETCSSGTHTLVEPGERVYPEAGNGGYASVHTDVHLVYDALANLLLPGTQVDLQQRSTQCLTDFSLDFDTHKGLTIGGPPGPT